jgi:hypothetical protein
MTTVTLLPNEDIVVSGSYSSVVDANDATFVFVTPTFDTQFGLATLTLPAGAAMKSATLTTRAYNRGYGAAGSGNVPLNVVLSLRDGLGVQYSSWSQNWGGETPATRATAPVALAIDQTTLDGLQVWLRHTTPPPYAGGPEYFGALVELSVGLIYATVPVVTVGGPSGTILSATQTLSWTYAGDPDADSSGTQQRYHVKVFTAAQYGALGFDPAVSTAAFDTGEVVSGVHAVSIGPLANLTTFRAYVQAAQGVNGTPHWSAWDEGATFTTNTDPPTVATITAVQTPDTEIDYLDALNGYVTSDDPGPLPTQCCFVVHVHRMGSPDGGIVNQWAAGNNWVMYMQGGNLTFQSNPTIARGQAALPMGETWFAVSFDQVAANGPTVKWDSPDGSVWTPGAVVTDPPLADEVHIPQPLRIGDAGGFWPFDGRIFSVELRTGLDPRAGSVVWRFDASDYPGTGSSFVDPRGRTWTITAPNAILGGGAVKVMVERDTGHTDWTHVQVERSASDQVHWSPVRGALAVAAPNDIVTVYDYEQPEGVPLWYRARGLIMSGDTVLSQGDWKMTTGPTTWMVSGCGEWLRAAGEPTTAVLVELVVDEATDTVEHRVGLLDVIGRASPVTVWDTPGLGVGEMRVVTRTLTEGAELARLLRTAPVLLYQGRRMWGHPYRWMAITSHSTSRLPVNMYAWRDYREWVLSYVEVDAPPVLS